jgi:hypothetical protein
VLAPHEEALRAAWSRARSAEEDDDRVAAPLAQQLRAAALEVLAVLHGDARSR